VSTARGRKLLLDFDGGRLIVIEAAVGRGGIEIRHVATPEHPAGLLEKPAAEIGSWLRGALKDAGIKPGPATFALPRDEAVVKTVTIPAGEPGQPASVRTEEITELVRLQLTRQMPVAADSCIVDHIPPTSENAAPADGAERPLPRVFAGAVPLASVERRRSIAKAAGLKLEAVELRSAGVRQLASLVSPAEAEAVLAVHAGFGAAELVVIDGGRQALSRAVDVRRPQGESEPHAAAERIAVEASRTAISHRVSAGAGELAAVIVLGDDDFARAIADACASQLELPARTIGAAAAIEGLDRVDPQVRSVILTHAGMLLRGAVGQPALNFAAPRKAPDRSARVRQLALAAVLTLIIAGGGFWVWAQGRLAEIDAQAAPLQDELAELTRRYNARVIELSRLRHLEAWTSPEVDWLAHLESLEAAIPDPPEALLEDLSLRMEPAVAFVPGERPERSDGWSTRQTARFRMAGVARDRAVIQSLRQTLLDDPIYRVESRGPETERTFEFDLITRYAAPPESAGPEGALAREPSP